MGKFCCQVPGCLSSTTRKRNTSRYPWMTRHNVTFHAFPSEKTQGKMRKLWLAQIHRVGFKPSRYQKVCSLHFVGLQGPTKSHSYPTLFHWNKFGKGRPRITRNSARASQVSVVPAVPPRPVATGSTTTQTVQNVPVTGVVDVPPPTSDHLYCLNHAGVTLPDHSYAAENSTTTCSSTSVSTQTEITMSSHAFVSYDELSKDTVFTETVMKSNKSVRQYTGLPSVAVLLSLLSILEPLAMRMKYWGRRSSSSTKLYEENHYSKPGPKRKLSPLDEFVLTLVRLKMASKTFLLADLFHVSTTRVSQVFISWISLMDQVFTPLLKWPSKQRILNHMPPSFQKVFPKTRVIIDCSEFYVQRPKQPTPQSLTYSTYKSHNTFKVLFGITPSGAFSFVSNLWGGNASDRFITEHSGFIDLIEPTDDVMADRGFQIRDLLLRKNATLTIPAFTRKCDYGSGKRLNVNEVKRSKMISKFRIHVERAIGRLKTWSIVSTVMPLSLKPVATKIVKVLAFFCNLHPPLLKK